MAGLLINPNLLHGADLVEALFGVGAPPDGLARKNPRDYQERLRSYRAARKELYRLVRAGAPLHRRHGCGEYEADPEEVRRWHDDKYLPQIKAAGSAGLAVPRRPGRPRREAASKDGAPKGQRLAEIERLVGQGLSKRWIAQRLGVHVSTVHRVLAVARAKT